MYACSHVSLLWSSTPVKTFMVPPVRRTWWDRKPFWQMSQTGYGCPYTMGFAYGRAVVYNSLCFSSCADEGRADHVAVLSSALYPHSTTVFIFMILYSTLPMLWGQIDGATSIKDLSRIFLNFPTLAGHLWFMYPLISIYLFIPIISPWLSRVTVKEERFFIGLFLLSTCMPYLNRWFGEVWGQCFWNEYHMLWYFSGYLGYLVLAHYIHVHLTWNRSKRFIIGIVSMLIGAAITIYSFYVQAVPGEILPTPVLEIGWAFCTINCVLLTAGTFLMFSCIELPETPRFVLELSKLSYGMYLMHIFWLGLWVAVFKSVLPLPTVAAIPVIATCTFICCFVTTKVISLIPGGKWIVG